MKPTVNFFDVFSTSLGWMVLVGRDKVVKQLAFGHSSPQNAVQAILPEFLENAQAKAWYAQLNKRLRAYAQGNVDDFQDIVCDPGLVTEFRSKVLHQCRKIPYGQVVTYGQLAAQAGSPRAARAVGSCMATNRIPLIIPCHRVVGTSNSLGGYSAPGGISTKDKLLAMERGFYTVRSAN